MSTPNQPESTPAANGEINVTPGFEEKLQQFWLRNQRGLLALALVVLLAIVGKGAWEYMGVQKEREIGRAYALAKTPEQLQSFAKAQAGHELAGIAWVQVADAAYADGKYSDAVSAYQAARKDLTGGPIGDRAALGLAMAQLQSGQASEGQSGLKQLVDASGVSKGVQVEAAYQLASLAHASGNAEVVKQYTDRIMQIDPASPWAQRAMTLRTAGPAMAASSASSVQPAAAATTAPGESVIKLDLGK
jgi:predicted negative regulator of RcsB-dependent stress response